ncbi:ABC transporter ATP-binding protein [Vibrio tubiashii]|uniref:ABC transporter ATP-binding protein n=1 Tax=Vibrio tubiashii TaxID=29498 RepID=UPI003CE58FAC
MLSVTNLSKSFDDPQQGKSYVLKGVNLSVEAGEFVAVLGKSGCGKSTLIKCLSGMHDACSGQIQAAENLVSGYVFQEPRLLPWYTVKQNLQLAFNKQLRNSDEALKAIESALTLTGILDKIDAFPNQLSGGMAQRVAIARSLCREPNLLYMDEPFSALDALTRQNMQTELKRIHQKTQCSVVFITHDVREAVTLADRILVIENGVFKFEYNVKQSSLSRDQLTKTIIQQSFNH